MIPIKLTMRNFMCYRDAPPLSFEGIHTACICGDNGNGKSALIDAITWALWGQARGKSDDDLIHATQDETEVVFDFSAGRQAYRVVRKHSRPRKRQSSGQSSLDLLIGDDGGYRVISGDRIKQTEQKIRDILHMDYDTFVNSAFLRQGHADEFTCQPPTKRKEVLANILGLSVYDALEERAKEIARKREEDRGRLQSGIEEIGRELERKPEYQAQLGRVQDELKVVEAAVAEQTAEVERLRREKASLEHKASQVAELDRRIAEAESSLRKWDEQGSQRRRRVGEYEALVAQRTAIESGYGELVQVRKVHSELEQKFRRVAGLSEYRHRLEMAIERAQAGLLGEHRMTQGRMAELEARAGVSRIKEELQELEVAMRRLSAEEEALSRDRDRCRELQAAVSLLESGQAGLAREIEEVQGKLAILLARSEAVCPLCERELSEDGLALIEKKYNAERDSKALSLDSLRVEHARKKAEMKALDGDISARETRLGQERSRLQRSAGVANQRLAEAEQASLRLKEEKDTLGVIEERLARKDFAAAEQKALGEVERELAGMDYSPGEHEAAGRRLKELEPYEESKRRLDEAGRLLAQEKEFIAQAEHAAQVLRLGLEADRGRKQALSVELQSLPEVSSRLARAESAREAMVVRQKQVAEALGSARERLDRCAELEEKKRLKEAELGQVVKEEDIYRELAEAFGKGGIQAMLIELAVPELEIEANKLLGRMTDNRMHVKIETQRETKKGNVAETLDINISDEMGLRGYEMFSGGEAFRIDFAIRIALSRLLARRAGAPLPTLIIDEGFGTQDSTGLEKVKEAINSIQDDFEKILVITHIQELKDAFPTRIDVVKTAGGSTLEVG